LTLVSKATEILKVRRAMLSDLLHGRAALTPEMALCIEKASGPDMDHLLRMQLAYMWQKRGNMVGTSRSSDTSQSKDALASFVGQVANLRTDCQSVHPGPARTLATLLEN
jgi:addiction module HigA family antidote